MSRDPEHDTSSMSVQSLRRGAAAFMRRGRGSRPDVLRTQWNGTPAVLKDQNGCDAAFARLIGPLLARREARALERLDGLAGVPRLLGRPDRRSVLMEYIPAVPITRSTHDDWPDFFKRLEKLLGAMHERGVAHCDLRSPNNTLVDDSGAPVLVDFVASVTRGGRWNPVGRGVFHLFCGVDRRAVLKLKSMVAPDLVKSEERHLLAHRSLLHRAVRGLGIGIRSITRRLFTRSSSS